MKATYFGRNKVRELGLNRGAGVDRWVCDIHAIFIIIIYNIV
jgi:hypothetical protein